MYEYVFNNNDEYEDEWDASIYSFEEIPYEEFCEIVNKAYKECEKEHPIYKNNVDYVQVLQKVLEMDKRFFTPKLMATAYVGREYDRHTGKTDHYSKVRYIHNHNR